MKKRYLYILPFIVLTITGCKNSDDGYLKQQLIGVWQDELYTITDQETNEELRYIASYRFYEDSKFEILIRVRNSDRQLLGFFSLTEGSFDVNDKDLRLSPSMIYQAEETYVDTIEELKSQITTAIEEGGGSDYRMEFTNNFNSLTLYFDCPANANCAPNPELERVIIIIN